MYQLSLFHCQLMIRGGLALVFLWFGINLFIQPEYWVAQWLPPVIGRSADTLGVGALNIIFLIGILNIIVATSLATGFFFRGFSAISAIFLALIPVFHGLDMLSVLAFACAIMLAALTLWPERAYS